MRTDDIRFLFAYDRWATRKVLAELEGVDEGAWGAAGVVGDRGLGSILVHHLGAHQRWRHGLSQSQEQPAPEDDPLPTPDPWLPTSANGASATGW